MSKILQKRIPNNPHTWASIAQDWVDVNANRKGRTDFPLTFEGYLFSYAPNVFPYLDKRTLKVIEDTYDDVALRAFETGKV